jgi:hypothetical protein
MKSHIITNVFWLKVAEKVVKDNKNTIILLPFLTKKTGNFLQIYKIEKIICETQ